MAQTLSKDSNLSSNENIKHSPGGEIPDTRSGAPELERLRADLSIVRFLGSRGVLITLAIGVVGIVGSRLLRSRFMSEDLPSNDRLSA